MKVRFARWLSFLLLIPGLALLTVGIWVSFRSGPGDGLPAVLPALVLAGFGLAYRNMPYFIVSDGALAVPIIRGPKGQTAIPRRARLDASGSRLVMTAGGSRTVLPVYRGMAHPGDWAALQELIATDAEPDAH